MHLEFTLNGVLTAVEVEPETTALHLLREVLNLTGTKAGCESGHCGACSIILDDKLVKSCLLPARKLANRKLITIEGIHAPDGGPNDLQTSFLQHGATQCGYCIPGMVLAGEVLLARNPTPSRMDIRKAIAANLCRCTGYQQIIDAIEETAARRQAAAG